MDGLEARVNDEEHPQHIYHLQHLGSSNSGSARRSIHAGRHELDTYSHHIESISITQREPAKIVCACPRVQTRVESGRGRLNMSKEKAKPSCSWHHRPNFRGCRAVHIRLTFYC